VTTIAKEERLYAKISRTDYKKKYNVLSSLNVFVVFQLINHFRLTILGAIPPFCDRLLLVLLYASLTEMGYFYFLTIFTNVF